MSGYTAGIALSQVDEIILTHAHPDHANGLLTDTGARAFANAVLRIAEEELDFWFDDANEARFSDRKALFTGARKNIGPYRESGQVQVFKRGADLGGGLSSLALPGHTPGHSGVRISNSTEQFVIWGDLVHAAALQFSHPEVSIGFDIDPDQARATRLKAFDEFATDRIRIAGMHLPFPGIGHLARRGSGYAFVPQLWEHAL